MSSLRYGSSFLISSFLYAGIGFSILTFMEQPKVLKKVAEKVIKVAIITPQAKVVAPPVVVPTPPMVAPPKKVIKKPKPKKVIKKVKPKPKKVVKKVIPKPEPIIEEVYQEIPVVETYTTTPVPKKAVTQRTIPLHATSIDVEAKKRTFLSGLRSTIHANKKYPKMAKRRNIQGSVHAVFDIQSNGTVSNIQLSGASSILQKAVRKSIIKSFPIAIPVELNSKFPMVAVSINIDFILE